MTVPEPRRGDVTAAAPPADSAAAVPWARQQAKPQPRATQRRRRIVASLPEWEPQPPLEAVIRRGREY